MKSLIAFFLVALSVPALAQTMEARRIKQEMIQRTVDLENHAKEARRLFNEVKVAEACTQVAYLMRNTPAHARDVLGRMDMRKRSVRRMQDQAVDMLQIVESVHYACRSTDHGDVDPESAARMMRVYAARMQDHRDGIEDRSVEFSNSYRYRYDYR